MTVEQQEGNRAADESTDYARQWQDKDMRDLASWAAGKHRAYDKLGSETDKLAIQTIMEGTRREKARNQTDAQEGQIGNKKAKISPMTYPRDGGNLFSWNLRMLHREPRTHGMLGYHGS